MQRAACVSVQTGGEAGDCASTGEVSEVQGGGLTGLARTGRCRGAGAQVGVVVGDGDMATRLVRVKGERGQVGRGSLGCQRY